MRFPTIRFRLVVLPLFLLSLMALADGFHIAPYLQNVTKDGVTIFWESQDESVGTVEYGLERKLDKQAKEDKPAKIHRVRIAGLTPETAYGYRVKAGSDEHSSVFKTAPATQRAITFIAIGDSRRWEKRWQETNMAEHIMQWNPEFVINNGDLVLEGHKYELWPEHFERFASFNDKIMMLSVRGNHEGPRKVDTENDWFAKYHDLPDGGEPVSTFDWGNTYFIVVSVDSLGESVEALEKALQDAKNKYTMVIFHYPIYCTGYASPTDDRKTNGEGLERIWRLLDKYHVAIHLAGHTHIYERTWPLRDDKRNDKEGTTYVIQGGDINANYPDSWSAATDDPATMAKPTYTVFFCKDDRIESRTFCWGSKENKIVEVDHLIIWRDESVPAASLAGLPAKTGDELIKGIDELGAMMYGPAAKALAPYLAQKDQAVRRAAAAALCSIGSREAAEAALLYIKDGDVIVGKEAARALEIAMPESLAKPVAEAAQDKAVNENVRVRLIGALQLHAPAATARETVLGILKGDDRGAVRDRAAYVLAYVCTKKDVKLLTKLLDKEPEQFAMLRIAFALNKLTGKKVSLNDRQPLAKSTPGNRKEFVKEWLSD
jgi:hypothetical protein